jgi:hypothetical protein
MFGEIKKILGIEDIKIDILLKDHPKNINGTIGDGSDVVGKVSGVIKLTTFRDSKVESLEVNVYEKYERGRSESKLIDEYKIGSITLPQFIEVKKNEIIEIPFEVELKNYKSSIDRYQESNVLLGGIAYLAKLAKGVKSSFRIEAIAYVTGIKLLPSISKPIILK